MFGRLYIDNIADFAVNYSFLNSVIKRSISENMANHNLRIVFLCTVNYLTHFIFVWCKRLFKEHIVSRIEKRYCRFKMLFIHCAVDDCICEFAVLCEFFGIFKTHIF